MVVECGKDGISQGLIERPGLKVDLALHAPDKRAVSIPQKHLERLKTQ
jgi:hypothetical protein